jgi:hypothetical protein
MIIKSNMWKIVGRFIKATEYPIIPIKTTKDSFFRMRNSYSTGRRYFHRYHVISALTYRRCVVAPICRRVELSVRKFVVAAICCCAELS